MRKVLLPFFAATFLVAANLPQQAPVTPNDIENNINYSKQKSISNDIENIKVDKNLTKTSEEIKVPKQLTFVLKGVNIVGATIFSQKDFSKIVNPYLNTKVDAKILKQIAKKITELYVKAGYITSKCILPPQKIKNGIVTFKVIEDRLAGIIIQGDEAYTYNSKIFTKYLNSIRGKIIQLDTLNNALRLLSLLPGTKIKPKLTKDKRGHTILILNVTPKKDVYSVSLDNSGGEYTGIYRYKFNGSLFNIFGVSDSFNFSLLTASNPKYLDSFSANYTLPVGKYGAILQMGYSKSYYMLNPDKVGTNAVIYTGNGDILSLMYLRPLATKKFNASYFLGFEKKENEADTIQNNDGSILIKGIEKFFVVKLGINLSKVDSFFGQEYKAQNSFNFTLKRAIEGFMGSMTTQDLTRKENDDTFPIVGPIRYGNVDPGFKLYTINVARKQVLPKNYMFNLSARAGYSKKKRLPDSYLYNGGDYGYGFSTSIAKDLNSHISASVSYSYSKTYYRNYSTSSGILPTSNSVSKGVGLSISASYKDFFGNVSYSSGVDEWTNPRDFKFSIGMKF